MFDQYLRDIIEKVANSYGEDFFNSITLQLNNIIKADYTFIARLNAEANTSRTIALVAHGALVDNFEYSLDHTPCAEVKDDSVCCYPAEVCKLFPKDQLLIDMKIEAYLGTPLRDSSGQVMGLIVALYEQPIQDESLTLALFEVFSGRIAAEVERQEYEQALETLNQTLEQRVIDRTQELQNTLESLHLTQQQLIESEKMAALGKLVAGVAHEVNTPLGVAVTACSFLEHEFQLFSKLLAQKQLTQSQLDQFTSSAEEALPIITSNLNRATELVRNFKRVAADQHEENIETINLAEYYQQVTKALSPLLKEKSVTLELALPTTLLNTYPGVHAQILTNLIKNSVMHGFASHDHNQIAITGRVTPEGGLEITYRDNGVGFNLQDTKKVFEPFYTTARAKGGLGLGMSIVYNLVTQHLGGSIQVVPSDSGAVILYRFPIH